MHGRLLPPAMLGLAYCLAFWLAWCLPAGPAIAQALPDRATLLRVAVGVLKVEVQRARGGYGLGSAVALAPDLLATNCHVTRDAAVIHVLRNGQRWPADAQAVDAEHDLCVLRVPGLGAPAVPLGRSADMKPGQAVTAFGYTGGLELQHSAGEVVALHRLDGGRVIQSTNAFSSGASGGGLFDAQQRLVGILTFRLRGGQAHYFSAPVEWLLPLLNDSARYGAVQPQTGAAAAYWQQPPTRQPWFLQAAVLTRESRWPELAELGQRWSAADADDPQAWYQQAVALESMQRWPEAQAALERVLRLEPDAAQAWLQLGLLQARHGHTAAARHSLSRLQALQPELAAELGRALGP